MLEGMRIHYFILGLTLDNMIMAVGHRFGCPADGGSLIWLFPTFNFLMMAAVTWYVEDRK